MRIRKTVAIIAVAVLAASLFVPAIANAATSAEFNARVYAQNKDLYAFTIDNTHIEYYNPNNAALGVESATGSVPGDKDIHLVNTGATPFEILVKASNDPTATDGVETLYVPLAEDPYDNGQSMYTSTPSGGMGKMAWWWGRESSFEPGFYETAGLVSAVANRSLGIVAEGDSCTLHTEVTSPTHWPRNVKTDYNWGGTIIASSID